MSLTNEQKITLAKKKLTSLGTTIKSIYESGRSARTDPSQNSTFLGMFRSIDTIYQQFNTTWDQLAELCMLASIEFPSETKSNFQQNVNRYFFEAGGIYEEIKSSLAANTCSNVPVVSTDASGLNLSQSRRCRLPKINLPHFNGTLSDWISFRDIFVSLVHNDDTISNIEKFHFLLGSLSGSALSVIKNISVTEANYLQAWEALVLRFNNRRKLAASYLNQLINFKPLQGKPTASSLHKFLSVVSESITSFNNLNIPDAKNYILFELAVRCLDPVTREAFEINVIDNEFPTFQELVKFIEDRAKVLSNMSSIAQGADAVSKPARPAQPNKFQPQPTTSGTNRLSLFAHSKSAKNEVAKQSSANSNQTTQSIRSNSGLPKCLICSNRHSLTKCPSYMSSSPLQRFTMLKNWSGCRNCLFPGHKTKSCTSKWTCRECGARHHTTLHLSNSQPKSDEKLVASSQSHNNDNITSSTPALPNQSSETFAGSSSNTASDVLLGTALAKIQDTYGVAHTLRLVLDCGSQQSFITETCAKSLKLPIRKLNKVITGVGGTVLDKIIGVVCCAITPLTPCGLTITSEAVMVPNITPLIPQRRVPASIVQSYCSDNLADPNFFSPGTIDMLLGADVFAHVVTGIPKVGVPNGPQILPTIFGDVIMGKFKVEKVSESSLACFTTIEENNLSQIINKFWVTEEVGNTQPVLSPLDQDCEQHFQHSHRRLPCGRYVVSLPFKDNPPESFPSKQQALVRLYHLESKLAKNDTLRENYHSFLREYEQLGHMHKTLDPANCYIPHHAVVKHDNGVKLRVVFDGSASTSKGSLNDHLLIGPKLQKDISDILLNFRRHPVAITTDIVKMYRQILIHKPDRLYQHILWRFNRDDPVEEYELDTVTYGLSCSPYLALRVIHQLVQDEGKHYPEAAHVLLNDIYVDDIVTGANSIDQAIILKEQMVALLSKGGFSLSKWASNFNEILPESEVMNYPVSFTPPDDGSVKILGLQWDTNHDVFSYKVQLPSHISTTKRTILSTIARLFDPLGYLSPTIFYAKFILQETWRSRTDWDEEVEPHIFHPWQAFVNDLYNLERIKIPRFILDDSYHVYSIVGFCDASLKGYCAAVYLRKCDGHSAQLSLLKAKTKLAPIKPMTIPRLELCATLLLSRLFTTLSHFMQELGITNVVLFTDSAVVLGWLHTPPHQLKTFVAHRVIEINDNTNINWWRHVGTSDNPADCGSRGILPSQLLNHPLWWAGPTWIQNPESTWPISLSPATESLPELKSNVVALTAVKFESDFLEWFETFSSYTKLIRSMAYVLRFTINSNPKCTTRRIGPIEADEFRQANTKCLNLLQLYYYPNAFANYNNQPQQSSFLRSLNTFIDSAGLLRVGGRIQHSNLPDHQKHPILLPRRSHFTNLIVDYYHKTNSHIGGAALQACIQQQYWIPGIKALIKQRKSKCLICYKISKQPQPVYMGNLPSTRFDQTRAFINTGVDFAGPFLCRESTRRNSPTVKSYLCLFVCLATKAVHLEIVPQLTTEAFLNALEMFISRRGRPSQIVSDCGTNFVGAARYLQEVVNWLLSQETKQRVVEWTANIGIQWSFNPPHSPHFGGIWEAGVKSTKALLMKTLGNQPFTDQELRTMFTKIEAILNSRPLTPVSSDPSDLQPLTPGHFLIGEPMTAIPEHNFIDIPSNRLSRWQFLRERMQFFWERWRNEYLVTLQQRKKWTVSGRNIQVGELVLIKEPNVPVLKWPLGRVLETHPGSDSIVRVVTIRTKTGTYKRPVVSLVSLSPITNPTNQKS